MPDAGPVGLGGDLETVFPGLAVLDARWADVVRQTGAALPWLRTSPHRPHARAVANVY